VTARLLLAKANVATDPTEYAQLRIEAIRTALAVGVGTGGLVALFLSARRQYVSEREHVLQNQIAKDNQHDAAERRVTELYAKPLTSWRVKMLHQGLLRYTHWSAWHSRIRNTGKR
jgi:hypothetical protein